MFHTKDGLYVVHRLKMPICIRLFWQHLPAIRAGSSRCRSRVVWL